MSRMLQRAVQFILFSMMLMGYGYLANAADTTFGHPALTYQLSNCLYAKTTCASATKYHSGIDYSQNGSRDIVASNAGNVVYVQFKSASDHGMGNNVIIEHVLENNSKVYSSYSHLASINVSNGQAVLKGQKIGTMGGSGYGADSYWGTHLHFEIKDKPVTNNPLGSAQYWGYMPTHPDNYGYHDPNAYIGKVSVKTAKSIKSLTLSCPSSVNESTLTAGVCTATAYYSDNSSKTVIPSSWSDNSSALSIGSNGTISTTSVSADSLVTVQGIYSEGGQTVQAMTSFTLKDVPAIGVPKVTSVTPSIARYGQKTTFTVRGSGLTNNTAFWIDQCAGQTSDGGDSMTRTFTCTPSYSRGVKSGVVKDRAGGITLYNFTITVQ